MSKMPVVTYPYGPGSVTVRIDHVSAVVVKPKHFSPPGCPVPETEPWIMEIRARGNWFSIEYETQEEANEHRHQLAKLMARNDSSTVPVEVMV